MGRHGRHRPEDELGDAALIRAARQRLLSELSQPHAQSAAHVINNYGAGGLMDHLGSSGGGAGGGHGEEDPYEYLVDISRRDVTDPASGERIGWDKKVHRHREKKK